MSDIVVKKPTDAELTDLGVDSWPIWEKEVSKFDWSYDDTETCFILEGSAKVTPSEGGAVEFGKGDLVVFPKGMSCVWEITGDIRKHYKFG